MTASKHTKLFLPSKGYKRLFNSFTISTVNFYQDTPCWEGTRAPNPEGYTLFWDGDRDRPAHRVMYEVCIEIIEETLVCDHLCRNRICMNPVHIEPVTDLVNVMRGKGICAAYATQTHCKKGHEYTEANTYVRKGKNGRNQRHCRACVNQRYKEFHKRLRDLPADHPKRIQYRLMRERIDARRYRAS